MRDKKRRQGQVDNWESESNEISLEKELRMLGQSLKKKQRQKLDQKEEALSRTREQINEKLTQLWQDEI